ncbi:MAG: sulfatase [Candidatus Hydrogenedentes bacterium]|nr:sulfatase [Candidatus Hydrogenedentota bacterium]
MSTHKKTVQTINRRDFLGMSLAGLGATLLSNCATWPARAAAQGSHPNVLFIAIDDLNDWIGCLGGHPSALTPNIDRLAKRGVLFSNAHCQAPICGPSRASLMSGLRPSTTGIYGQIKDENIRRAGDATANCTFLPEYLAKHGYKTMGVGKLFHHHAPEGVLEVSGGREKGFGPKPPERWKWDNKGTSTDWGPFPDRDEEMPDYRSAQWAIERLHEDHERPFFLGVGFLRPHVPWHVPKKWFDLFDPEKLALPPYLVDDYADLPEIAIKLHEMPMMPTTDWAKKHNEWRNIVQAYLACVAFVDHYVGEVVNALEQTAYAENTVIVLWADHGYHLGEKNRFAKHSLWERATRAPLIFAGPGINGGKRCNKPAGMLDIYPTLLEVCGLPANRQNEGHSLAPLLANPNADWPYAAITTYGYKNHAVKTERYRYIVYENGAEELYEHEDDHHEWYNRASDPDYANIKEQLRRHLPKKNAPWSRQAPLNVNDFFTEQQERTMADLGK